MSINAATSSSSTVSTSSAVTTSSQADSAKKSTTDSSFKDEMDKVSTKEQKSSENKTSEVSEKKDSVDSVKDNSKQNETKAETKDVQLEGAVDYSKYGSMAVMDVNSMLTNDIRQMMGVNSAFATEETTNKFDFMTLDFTNSVSVSASDAEFFVGLTQNNDVSMANITAQAQNMLNNGAEVAEVRQNVQISQTLLNAINAAKENNQPLRIDFDQNVAVILKINKEGVISANFIPGDKAVEQYLKNNISSLRAAFEEQELPYSDLSYSNRGSKQQKEKRNNNK